jgi:hydroxypyruvate isomerase
MPAVLESPLGLKLAANCSILFQDLPLLDRPAAARAAGFTAVEYWWPFEEAAPGDTAVDAFVASVEDAGVQLIGLNSFAGKMPAGDRGIVSHPNREAEFRANLEVLVGICERLGCGASNVLYGNALPEFSPEASRATAVERYLEAASAFAKISGIVLIEEVSGIASYPLRSVAESLAVVEDVRAAGAENVAFLYDSFHIAANGEDPLEALTRSMPLIGHVQIADFPGRGAPGTGEIDFAAIFTVLERERPDSWVALEYIGIDTGSAFGWIAPTNAETNEGSDD